MCTQVTRRRALVAAAQARGLVEADLNRRGGTAAIVWLPRARQQQQQQQPTHLSAYAASVPEEFRELVTVLEQFHEVRLAGVCVCVCGSRE
jgi:hypothetical protein